MNKDAPALVKSEAKTLAPRPQDLISVKVELLKIAIPLTMALLTIVLFHYWYFVDAKTAALMRSERLRTELINQVVTGDMANVISDTQLLADYFQQLMASRLTVNESSQQLLTQILLMSKHRRLYDHIRLLDTAGNETIRVNFNEGNPVMISKERLQNKAKRYYFSEINALAEGEIYISPMDLNIEGDSIELPLKPTIRSGMSLFRDNEETGQREKVGLLILNYDARNLISRFQKAAGESLNHAMLVNHQGYWLISPDPNDNWGFMFDQSHSFKNLYPEEWLLINKSDHGQEQTEEGLFSFTTATPFLEASSTNYWKIISQITTAQLREPQQNFVNRYLPIYLILLLFFLLISIVFARYRVSHHKAELQSAYEGRFRQTLEDIQLLAVIIDARGTIVFCNERLLHFARMTEDRVIGQNWFEIFLKRLDRQAEQVFIEGVLQRNRPPEKPHESTISDQDGKAFLISWSVTPTRDSDGSPIGITLIGEDITEKRHAEVQLLTLNRAVEQSPSTVMITDTKGSINYVNRKFESLTGYTQAEVLGKNPRILKSGSIDDKAYRELWLTILNGQVWQGELKNRKKNGEFYWEFATIAPVRNADGEIIHFISLKEDITEKKNLEQKLEQRNQEILRNTELAAVGKMATMIAHDLRNPLSSIKLSLQMIGKMPIQKRLGQVQELTGISLEQIDYMESIITDVMNYSRPDALQQEWWEVTQLIDNSLIMMQRQINERAAVIHTDYPPGLPSIFVDAAKFQRIMSNLITNALQAVDERQGCSPQVTISVSQRITEQGPQVTIDIKDNGKGINHDHRDQQRFFEPFYTDKAKGTGLGLAIVKRFVELHAGTVTLTPITGGGACASVQLPVMPEKTLNPE